MEEMDYNHALFDSMAVFTDVVLEVNVESEMVRFLNDKIITDWRNTKVSVAEFLDRLAKINHPDYMDVCRRVFSKDFLSNLKTLYHYDNVVVIDGKEHRLNCVATPLCNEDGVVRIVYITIRNVQPLLDQREAEVRQREAEARVVESVLSSARIGIWKFLIGEGKPKFYCDYVTRKLVGGPDHFDPEEMYDFWIRRIETAFVDAVNDTVDKIKNGVQCEVVYPYNHPTLGKITVRCGGVRDLSYTGSGVVLRGYHQDITDTNERLLQQVQISDALQKHFSAVIDVDFLKAKGTVLWDPDRFLKSTTGSDNSISLDFSPYYYRFDNQSVEKLKMVFDFEYLSKELLEKNRISIEVESILDGWFRFSFVASAFDADGKMSHCLLTIEQIDQEKKEELNQRMLLEKALASEKKERDSLLSMAAIYSTMHVFNLNSNIADEIAANDTIRRILVEHGMESLQEKVWHVLDETISQEFLDRMIQFTNFATLGRRMEGKTNIYTEVRDKHNLWFRFGFIRIGDMKDPLSKVIFFSQDIDGSKRELEALIEHSITDELTKIYNRHAYETDLKKIQKDGIGKDLWYVNYDINGLKVANDTMGHAAGDELIIAAAESINSSCVKYGKTYRIGGDEFVSILHCSSVDINHVFSDLHRLCQNWHGRYCSSLSLSIGIVGAAEFPGHTIEDLEKEADKRMYIEKRAWHTSAGNDRRKRDR